MLGSLVVSMWFVLLYRMFFNGLFYHNFSQYDALFQIGSIKNVQEIQVPLRGTTKVFIPKWFD